METIKLKIDGIEVECAKGSTILEAAKLAGVEIPTLCFLKEINEIGACRICVVELKDGRIVASCVYPAENGMEVSTKSPRILEYRKQTLQLILSNHRRECLSCVRSGCCELQQLCQELGVDDEKKYDGVKNEYEIDSSAPHMLRDNTKCILCRRCVAVCESNQSVNVIGANERGFKTFIGSAFDMGLGETSCINCGQCISVCPTGALYEKDQTDEVFAAINDPDKYVVVQTAPAVRAALGEEFGLPIGTDVEGKMVAALRRLGFDKVFDTNFSADLTIMEEGTEFINRLKKGGRLPLITSCSPGWVRFCEYYFPEFIGNLSSCKSPQQMFGAVTKSYFAEKMRIDKEKIVCVSVMPCTAKKAELAREHQDGAGVPDVDISITTRELARMIKKARINFLALSDEGFDDPLGDATGAGVIFGATGGVMEAALRTVSEILEGRELEDINFTALRGTEGIKEAALNIAGTSVKVAVASGTANARALLDRIKSGEAEYHFVEIMGCPGGCVNGGGQPQQPGHIRNSVNIPELRAKALYANDEERALRKSHENPSIKKIYEEYFGEPGSDKAHHLLHTSYKARKINDYGF